MTISRSGASAGSVPIPDLVVGLGARACATCEEILTLIDRCLGEAGAERTQILFCATQGDRIAHPGLVAAARALGVSLEAVMDEALPASVPNPSIAVFHARGVASVAEAAAIASGRLLLEKRKSANATCALARIGYGADSTLSASSTLLTSGARA